MRDALIFLSGLGIGVASTLYFAKKHYEKKADEEIQAMRDYYIHKKEEGETSYDDLEQPPQINHLERPSMDELKEKYMPNRAVETEHPVDSDEDEELDDEEEIDEHTKEEWDDIGHRQIEEDRERSKLKPKLISVDDYGEYPNFDSSELTYYQDTDVLEDENGEEVEDVASLVGDCMEKFAFTDSDEEDLFVRNFRLATDYHIHKVF